MCLGIPGKIINVRQDALAMATVAFGGIRKEICVAYVPEAQVGDYVIVHAGFAITRLDEAEAQRTLLYLDELGDLSQLGNDVRVDSDGELELNNAGADT